MLALLDAGRWAWSFITAHWKGAVILLAVLLVWGYGRWQYSVGEAHADAIWAERVEAARVAAARQEERWNGRLDASEKERNELRQDVEVRDGIIGRVNDSVRQLGAARTEQLSTRLGNSLRVYIDRPWFQTGNGELLGVVLHPNDNGAFNKLAESQVPFVTQWGLDPLHDSDHPKANTKATDFPTRVFTENVQLLENGQSVTVVGHRVQWDADRKLWFADIEIADAATLQPIIPLAQEKLGIDPEALVRVLLEVDEGVGIDAARTKQCHDRNGAPDADDPVAERRAAAPGCSAQSWPKVIFTAFSSTCRQRPAWV